MSIKDAINNIMENNLVAMRENFSAAITTRAVEKLEEKKLEIAKSYFAKNKD